MRSDSDNPRKLLPTSFHLQISRRIVLRGLCKPTPNDAGVGRRGGGEQVLSGSVGSILESYSQVGAALAAGVLLGCRWKLRWCTVRAPGQGESRGEEVKTCPRCHHCGETPTGAVAARLLCPRGLHCNPHQAFCNHALLPGS